MGACGFNAFPPLCALVGCGQLFDFSAAADVFPAAYSTIGSWFLTRSNPNVIMDGRIAADTLRGSACINSTAGTANINLLVNYYVREGQWDLLLSGSSGVFRGLSLCRGAPALVASRAHAADESDQHTPCSLGICSQGPGKGHGGMGQRFCRTLSPALEA
jgi:hypothetical protein